MENNIFNLLSLFSGQFGNNQNGLFSQEQNPAQNNFNSQAYQQKNPSFANFPEEAFSNFEKEKTVNTQSFNNQDSMGGMMPLLMQMLGGKTGGGIGNMLGGSANTAGLENLMKGSNLDMASLFSSSKSTKKEGIAPKDDIIL